MIMEKISCQMAKEKKIKNASNAAEIVRAMLNQRISIQEHFVVLTLNSQSYVIGARILFIGTVDGSMVHPRDVFRCAIEDNANAIIIAHNHPSGVLENSQADDAITRRLIEGGKILGIEILDHVIVTKESHFSYSEECLL